MSDLMASFEIFAGNFNAQYGRILNLVLPLLALLVLLALAVRTAAVAAHAQRQADLPDPEPDAGDKARLGEALAAAVQIPSVTGDEAALADLRRMLEQRYPLVFSRLQRLEPEAPYILLRWKGTDPDKKASLLCAHLDVVPVAGDWGDRDPFGGQIEEGILYGRGAVDCKATLILTLDSVQQLLEQGFVPKGDIYLAFGHDEEIGGAQGAAKMAALLAEQNVSFDLVLDEGTPIYKNYLDSEDLPAALIAIGEKGCCNYRLTATGTAGHASVPPRHTAVGILAEAICRIEAAQPRSRVLPQLKSFFKDSAGAMSFGKRFVAVNFPVRPLLAAAFRDDKYVMPLLRSTTAVTMAQGADAPNVLPGAATAVINCRLLQGDTPEGMLQRLRDLVADLPMQVDMIMENPASPLADPEGETYRLVAGLVPECFGPMPVIPTVTTVATDSRHYLPIAETVLRFCPLPVTREEYAAMHGAPERISLYSLALGGRFYRELIQKL